MHDTGRQKYGLVLPELFLRANLLPVYPRELPGFLACVMRENSCCGQNFPIRTGGTTIEIAAE
jgi:hypothetical protein